MEKDWRSLANGDQETDKQKSEYDQTEYQYMRLRATVFSKWLEFLPSIVRRVLMHREADINAIDKDNMTALLYAVSLNHLDLVIELMSPEHGASPTRTGTIPAVSLAAQKGSMKVLKYFIPEAAAEQNSSPELSQRLRQLLVRNLTMVFRTGRQPPVDPHQLDLEGRCPLWLAVANGHKEVIEHIRATWSQDEVQAVKFLDPESASRMRSSVECGIFQQTTNTSRFCPETLPCGHPVTYSS